MSFASHITRTACLAVGILSCFGTALLIPPCAVADDASWQALISSSPTMPPRIVAVDKKRQQLFIFNRGSAPNRAAAYICTTGQNTGDKQVEGDLKTPEGVYFVVQHLRSGLDYTLYGNEAYTLNYPNPIDRLRRKTGYGIWIHGRGETLYPLQTQGCVAMNNGDLTVIGKLLKPGTPVVLSDSLQQDSAPSRAEANAVQALEKRVQDWAKAWGDRSHAMFDFYNADAYSVAQGEDFSKFKAQKERLFKMLPWITTSVRDIQVLRGPGYWVTWFYQEYAAPNLSTEGVRRLYWAQDDSGEFRILGMEWMPGMSTGTLVASAEPAVPPVDPSPRSEEQARPLPQAMAIAAREPSVLPAPRQTPPNPAHSSLNLPPPLPAQGLASSQEDGNTPPVVTTLANAQTDTGESTPPSSSEETRAADEQARAAWEQAAKLATEEKIKAAKQRAAVETAEKKAQAAIERSLRQSAGKDRTPPEAAPVREKADVEAAEKKAQAAIDRSVKEAAASRKEETPEETKNAREIAAKEKAAKASEEAAAKQQALAAVTDFVETWRKAWLAGDLSAYMRCYAPSAKQGNRKGADDIREQKKELWTRLAPATVTLSDIRVTFKNADSARAEMVQSYADKKGNKDKGKKILTLTRVNGRWLILREDWAALAR